MAELDPDPVVILRPHNSFFQARVTSGMSKRSPGPETMKIRHGGISARASRRSAVQPWTTVTCDTAEGGGRRRPFIRGLEAAFFSWVLRSLGDGVEARDGFGYQTKDEAGTYCVRIAS